MAETQAQHEEISDDQLDRIERGEEHPPKPDFMTQEAYELLLASRKPEIVRAYSTSQVDHYRAQQAEGNIEEQGAPALLLTTIGRKSGNEITAPVTFMQHGDTYIIVASFFGFRSDPHWARNLDKNPQAWIEVNARRIPVTAQKATPEERSALWPKLSEYFPPWGYFQKYCRREFPVYLLTERDGEH
jgi:deazaflavin-dependent oxidoreductase (nitroreductase family)